MLLFFPGALTEWKTNFLESICFSTAKSAKGHEDHQALVGEGPQEVVQAPHDLLPQRAIHRIDGSIDQ